MAPRGRPPTPIGIKRALGNPGKRRLKHEPPIRKVMPDLEPWVVEQTSLDFAAKWMPILMRAGLLTEIDAVEFSMLADRYSEVLAWRALCLEVGFAEAVERGYQNARRRAEDDFHKRAEAYGFTALSRTRLASDEEGDQDDARGLDSLG